MNRIHFGKTSFKQLSPARSGHAVRIGLLLILLSLSLFAFAQETDSVKGYLLLQCNLPGVKYQINGREYTEVQYLPLTPGMYQVRAFGANPVTGPFAEERQMEIRQGETTVGKFDFPHGTLSLFSNETYARFTIDNAKLGKVENLPLPPGTYTVTATLPKAVTGFGDYLITRPITIQAGMHLDQSMDFRYGTVTINSSLDDTRYLIDGVSKKKVQKLKLLEGEHSYTAFPPAPHTARSGTFTIRAGEDLPLELEFAKTRQISDAEKRREYTWRFGLMPAAVLEANHYFSFAGTGQSGYTPLCNGFSVSGLRFKAINLWQKELTQPYTSRYPNYMIGGSLLDQAVFTWEKDNKHSGILLDLASVSTGLAHISPAGFLHAQIELIGHFSYQKPLVSEIGYYSYVTAFKEGSGRTYRVWGFQWGGETRLQLGVRLAKYNYLNLHLGARYQQPLGGDWYSNNDIAAWMTEDAELPQPDWPAGVPARNAAFDGFSLYAGIGLETNLIPSLLGLLLDKADKTEGSDLLN
ncbi:MAG: hypothetical protein GX466_07240 [Candidatus Cloacimonetes bacterium]|nr:hypothetical protein [Candidatus Cloacimonadota bacterium]